MIEPLLEAERALTVGMLDHAERVYRGVADTDPRNSIAVVGLARVALERGQDVEALQLARRALRIDEENVAARRLVARLEEVLTMRGVALPPEDSAPEPAAAPMAEAPRASSPGDASQASSADPELPAGPQPPASTRAPSRPTVTPPVPRPPVRAEVQRGLISRLLRRD